MKKFAPLFITAAAIATASLSGCAAESGDQPQMTTEDLQATCANPDGTNAAIAALAEAITHELHRWQVTTDFVVGTGSNNQQVLKLSAAGLAACGGKCPETQNMLAFQDSSMDQVLILDGTHVSSWAFASRVVTGFGNQVSCQKNKQCPFVAHVFDFKNGAYVPPVITSSTICDTLYTHPVAAPGGAALTSAQITQLSNALIWTTGNGPNPYIQFQGGAGTVTIDPTGDMNNPGAGSATYGCNQYSPTDLTHAACTCSTTGINNGMLKQTKPLATPNTYYCVAPF